MHTYDNNFKNRISLTQLAYMSCLQTVAFLLASPPTPLRGPRLAALEGNPKGILFRCTFARLLQSLDHVSIPNLKGKRSIMLRVP